MAWRINFRFAFRLRPAGFPAGFLYGEPLEGAVMTMGTNSLEQRR